MLYFLAAHPAYQREIREEVDQIVEEYGWNKEALARMFKADSFIKEIARYMGLGTSLFFLIAFHQMTYADAHNLSITYSVGTQGFHIL